MTWLDFALLIIWIAFMAMGARQGSLWLGFCLLGGFLGMALTDIYALPLSHMMGNFSGSIVLSAILLFLGGMLAMVIPGYFLSRIGSLFILNIIDSAVGFMTGAFVGLFLISLALIVLMPMAPKIEKSKAYKSSAIVKPYHQTLERWFSERPFHSWKGPKQIKKEAVLKLKPLTKKAEKTIKTIKKKLPD